MLSGKKKPLLRMCNKRPSVSRIQNLNLYTSIVQGTPSQESNTRWFLGWQHPSHLERRKPESYLEKGAFKTGCLRIPTDKILPSSKFRITKHTRKQTTLSKSQQKQNTVEFDILHKNYRHWNTDTWNISIFTMFKILKDRIGGMRKK